jgi:hypothetical protein
VWNLQADSQTLLVPWRLKLAKESTNVGQPQRASNKSMQSCNLGRI